jgi:hypothetical protein
MGSGRNSKRKNNDAPIIREPLSFSSIINEGRKGLPEIVSELCPTSFQERLENSPYLNEGINIFLLQKGARYSIMVHGTEIGFVSKRNSIKLFKCLEMGVRYSGKIVIHKGDYYARFFRETN